MKNRSPSIQTKFVDRKMKLRALLTFFLLPSWAAGADCYNFTVVAHMPNSDEEPYKYEVSAHRSIETYYADKGGTKMDSRFSEPSGKLFINEFDTLTPKDFYAEFKMEPICLRLGKNQDGTQEQQELVVDVTKLVPALLFGNYRFKRLGVFDLTQIASAIKNNQMIKAGQHFVSSGEPPHWRATDTETEWAVLRYDGMEEEQN